MLNKEILSALIGLAGAINNNGKTSDTDAIVRKALLSPGVSVVEEIHREKYRISPNCETCPSPCGNTSNYPLAAFESWTGETRQLKEQVMMQLQHIANNADPLPDIVYTAISYLGYDLNDDSYQKLLEEMRL